MIYIENLNNINETYRNDILRIIQEGFNRNDDMLLGMNNPIVCYMVENNKVVGVAFGDISNSRMMKPLKNKVLYIHTIAVDKNYRGKRISEKLVKKLVKVYKKDNAIYLHVRTTDDNPNYAAIKSYERCGFVLVNSIYVERDDGPNNVMILLSQIKANILNKGKRTNKKRSNKNRSNKKNRTKRK